MRAILITGLLLVATHSGAAEPPFPTFLNLRNDDLNTVDYIGGRCYMSGERLQCTFAQTDVSRGADPKKVEKEIDEAVGGINRLAERFCSREFREGIKQYPDVAGEDFRQVMQDWVNAHANFCEKRDEKSLRAFWRAMHASQTKTCQISINTYEEEFTMQPTGQWLSQRGPRGGCGVINISTLSKDPTDESSLAWIYETRRIMTNKEPSICKFFQEKLWRYSWNAAPSKMDCEFIDFRRYDHTPPG